MNQTIKELIRLNVKLNFAILEEFNDKSIINKIYKLQEAVNTI